MPHAFLEAQRHRGKTCKSQVRSGRAVSKQGLPAMEGLCAPDPTGVGSYTASQAAPWDGWEGNGWEGNGWEGNA